MARSWARWDAVSGSSAQVGGIVKGGDGELREKTGEEQGPNCHRPVASLENCGIRFERPIC